MKIITERIVRYYVQEEDWIYGGPFDTKEEAAECLKAYKASEKLKAKLAKEAAEAAKQP